MMDYDVALPPEAYHPRVKENLCVIVVGLVIRDCKVLLIQEAKNYCRGHYFLPAGRLEANETLIDGVRREVLEESGLLFEPRRCVLVESNGPFWISITFLGEFVGGSLKSDADSESLGAGWFHLGQIREAERVLMQNRRRKSSINGSHSKASDFILRAPVMHMVEAGLRYLSASQPGPDLLPCTPSTNVRCMLYQLAIVSVVKTNSASPSHLLLSGSRLPAFRLNGGHPTEMIDKFIQILFPNNSVHSWEMETISVLGVVVTPRSPMDDSGQTDGLTVTLRIIIPPTPLLAVPRPDFQWYELQSSDTFLQPLMQLVSLPFETNLLPPYLHHAVHQTDLVLVKRVDDTRHRPNNTGTY